MEEVDTAKIVYEISEKNRKETEARKTIELYEIAKNFVEKRAGEIEEYLKHNKKLYEALFYYEGDEVKVIVMKSSFQTLFSLDRHKFYIMIRYNDLNYFNVKEYLLEQLQTQLYYNLKDI